MRPRRATRVPTMLGAGLVVLMFAGCSAGAGSSVDGGAPTETTAATTPPAAEPDGTPATSEPTPWDPGDIPDPSAAVAVLPAQRGDCDVDPAEYGLVTLVVSSDDAETPIEVTYDVFRTDGTVQVRRMTQPGPVLLVVQQDCTDGVVSEPWRFTATSDGAGALTCELIFAGRQITTDHASDEGGDGELAVDCTGHPGM